MGPGSQPEIPPRCLTRLGLCLAAAGGRCGGGEEAVALSQKDSVLALPLASGVTLGQFLHLSLLGRLTYESGNNGSFPELL